MKTSVQAEPERMRELIKVHLPQLDDVTAAKFVRYYEMLIERNNKMNLTAITDPEGVVLRHFADSLLAAEQIKPNALCIDVGTGAGFPGIPLKLMRPDIKLTLLDSLNKRINFLKDVISELGIACKLLHSRVEDAGRSAEHREKYDIALSRAVAPAAILTEWTLPLVKNGGASIMYKGPTAETELVTAENAFRELGSTAEILLFETEWGARRLIIATKHMQTPEKYPRRPGVAEKAPL